MLAGFGQRPGPHLFRLFHRKDAKNAKKILKLRALGVFAVISSKFRYWHIEFLKNAALLRIIDEWHVPSRIPF
jgi:hypothetical protein